MENITSETVQHLESLQVLLQDLERAGVSDVVSDDSFDFCDDSFDTKVLAYKAPAPVVAVSAQSASGVVSSVADKLSAAPKKEKPFKIDDFVWEFGEQKDLLVILSTDEKKGSAPLSDMATSLFTKMLAAIDLKMEDVSFLALKGTDATGKPHNSKNSSKLKSHVENMVEKAKPQAVLVVGQESGRTLFGENLSALRKQDISCGGVVSVALPHPQMLLKQPALKRMAWQDLLKFKSCIGDA